MPIQTRRKSLAAKQADVDNFTKVKSPTKQKSWYEQRREDNLRANAEFLASLNIKEAKSALKLASNGKKEKSSIRGIKAKVHVEAREYHLRPLKSLRLKSTFMDVDPLISLPLSVRRSVHSISMRGVSGAPTSHTADEEPEPINSRLREHIVTWEDSLVNKDTACPQMLIDRVNSADAETKVKQGNLKEFTNRCLKMSLSRELVAKVTPQRIYSIDLHPSRNRSPLLAAGDKWGHVGFWNVRPTREDVDDGVCLYKPHTGPVTCTQFSSYDHQSLYTSSYDGTVRRCDVNKQQFLMIYSTPVEEDVRHMYLSEVDRNTVCVVSTDSSVVYIDSRTDKPRLFDINSGKLKCVSHHPVEKQYLITASVQGRVELWDDRFINKKGQPLISLPQNKGALSAFFSPLTGEKILSCSAGDRISVYDSSQLFNITPVHSFHHNNWTGRWLSNFRAVWHPSREDCFVIGSMKHPRQIELYGCDGQLLHSFSDGGDILQSVTSLNAFHPSQPLLTGANSSGRVFVFMDPDTILD